MQRSDLIEGSGGGGLPTAFNSHAGFISQAAERDLLEERRGQASQHRTCTAEDKRVAIVDSAPGAERDRIRPPR